MTNRSLVLAIAGLSVLRLFAAARAGLAPDETYYWLWSRHLAFGYYDHPPMVAWLIAASTALFGNSALAIRLPFVLIIAATSAVAYQIGQTLFGGCNIARRSALWLNASVLIGVGGILATPDPPSALLWALAVLALAKVLRTGNGRWWLAFGFAAGLGVEAKYTGLFLGLGVLAWFALDRRARLWLMTPWPWMGGAIAVMVIAPNLIWNAGHGFQTIGKQFGRIAADHLTLRFVPELLAGQIALFNPFAAAILALAIDRLLRRRFSDGGRYAYGLLFASSLPLLAYMAVHVFHDRVQANWPAPVYGPLIVVAAAFADIITANGSTWMRRSVAAAAPFGIGVSVIALLWLSLPGSMVAHIRDPAQMTRGWDTSAAGIEAIRKAAGAGWIGAWDYAVVGELSYHLRDIAPVYGISETRRYPWQGRLPAGTRGVIVLTRPSEATDISACYDDWRAEGTIIRHAGGGTDSRLYLFSGVLQGQPEDGPATSGSLRPSAGGKRCHVA